jgi:hypothetical protein
VCAEEAVRYVPRRHRPSGLALAAAEGCLQDVPGDRGGGCAAEPGADEHDRDGSRRVQGGCECDEPCVGVLGVGGVRAQFGGAGLAGDVDPGIAAAVPVPERTTSCIIDRTSCAVFVERIFVAWTGSIVAIRGRTRRPSVAIVAPTLAICSGVAGSRSWPIAAAPTARLSRSCDGGEIVLGLAAGICGCSPHPKARAIATSRRAPSLAPSGANTELQRTKDVAAYERAPKNRAGVLKSAERETANA